MEEVGDFEERLTEHPSFQPEKEQQGHVQTHEARVCPNT